MNKTYYVKMIKNNDGSIWPANDEMIDISIFENLEDAKTSLTNDIKKISKRKIDDENIDLESGIYYPKVNDLVLYELQELNYANNRDITVISNIEIIINCFF